MSTLPKMLEYHRIATVPHGFRSSFRDWAAERSAALPGPVSPVRGRVSMQFCTSSSYQPVALGPILIDCGKIPRCCRARIVEWDSPSTPVPA